MESSLPVFANRRALRARSSRRVDSLSSRAGFADGTTKTRNIDAAVYSTERSQASAAAAWIVEPRLRKPGAIRREKKGLMNFDELWRKNLKREQSLEYRKDQQEEPSRHESTSEHPSEWNLTAEDCTFLSQVGIKT